MQRENSACRNRIPRQNRDVPKLPRNLALAVVWLPAAASWAADSQQAVPPLADNFGIGAFVHENWKVLLALASALGILVLLGYLYLRGLRLNRGLRKQHRANAGQSIVALGLTDGTRKPWIYSETSAPPGNGHWFKSPSARKNSGLLVVQGDTEIDELYVDGRFVGMAPAKLRLKEGRYSVEVKRAGFKSYRRQISVMVGAEVTLRAVFEREPSLPPSPQEC